MFWPNNSDDAALPVIDLRCSSKILVLFETIFLLILIRVFSKEMSHLLQHFYPNISHHLTQLGIAPQMYFILFVSF